MSKRPCLAVLLIVAVAHPFLYKHGKIPLNLYQTPNMSDIEGGCEG